MEQTAAHARSRYYRRLGGGSRILATCRPEDRMWHAERIRPDGLVVDWAYAPSLEGALADLGAMNEQELKTPLPIGPRLRETRSELGLGLAEVEAATMIPARYLDALEQERFELLPVGLYRRSYLREYASHLGLAGQPFVDEYEARFPLPALAPAPRRPELGSKPRFGAVTSARAVVLALVALAAGAMWWLGSNPTKTRKPATPAAHETQVRAKPAAPAPTRPVRPVPATRSRTPAPLTLTATGGSCWLLVQIGSSAGPVVYEQTLQQGQSVRLGLRKRLWIRLGAPANLDATIGRRAVTSSLPADTGDVIATSAGLRRVS